MCCVVVCFVVVCCVVVCSVVRCVVVRFVALLCVLSVVCYDCLTIGPYLSNPHLYKAVCVVVSYTNQHCLCNLCCCFNAQAYP